MISYMTRISYKTCNILYDIVPDITLIFDRHNQMYYINIYYAFIVMYDIVCNIITDIISDIREHNLMYDIKKKMIIKYAMSCMISYKNKDTMYDIMYYYYKFWTQFLFFLCIFIMENKFSTSFHGANIIYHRNLFWKSFIPRVSINQDKYFYSDSSVA